MVRTRALERSSRVERSARANAFSFAFRAPAGSGGRAPGGMRSTPKFLGRYRLSQAIPASAKMSRGLKRARARGRAFAGEPVGVSAISHLTGGVATEAVIAGVELSAVNPS